VVFFFDSVLAEGDAAYSRSGWGVFSFVGGPLFYEITKWSCG